MIPVEYADVTKVAEVVKEVYREQIEVNPMMGGGDPVEAAAGSIRWRC